ncbi:MAG: hypothetical protein ACTH3D_12605 [Halomonas sp.]|uniref:hypothetical protein n=1 Tax=Halomonas sp. TaxID=1486246 RepID=UPI003F926F6B
MTIITRDALAQAAHEGTGIEYLTPGQAWAADHLAKALDADEGDPLAHAEKAGFADQLRTMPPNPLH